MTNPFAGFWSDPKYSLIRHALITGSGTLVVLVLQALTQTSFGGAWDIIIATVAGLGIRWASTFASQ